MAEKKSTKPKGYEYLDHTADVQIHAWGTNMKECFEQAALGLFGYMTEIDSVEIDPDMEPTAIEVQAEDLESLLYTFLEEFLFVFGTDYKVFKQIEIVEFDRKNFKIKANALGEEFSLDKHPQGTEIKAITYSAMKVTESSDFAEVYVIVDI
eukprot:TRINITY_DN2817_c0_g1_i1.p1 TRINITY_DN2817_c0_g1~~TRINITY_DN2817_c0_g1_i1.p1  ORF type:complete len:152 (-),score=31.93 TRINITY_DN2817_c0_g1_i1:195-650(-)